MHISISIIIHVIMSAISSHKLTFYPFLSFLFNVDVQVAKVKKITSMVATCMRFEEV